MEAALAVQAVAILRSAGVSDAEILTDYTKSFPRADRAYERAIFADYQTKVSASKVKAEMRKLVTG